MLLYIAPLTIPVGTLVKFHSSQISQHCPTPVGHKFVKPKISDYSNKLRVGLGRCHLEQKNNCFKFDGQIQVGRVDHFLMFISANCNSAKITRPADVTASCP